MLDKTRLRIAMQKSGRLSDESQELLSRCGIKINLQQQRLIAFAENMPIDILRVRDDDIPGLVMMVWSIWVLSARTCWKKSYLIAALKATTLAISPYVAWILVAAAFHWPPHWMLNTLGRNACKIRVSPPLIRTF